MSTKTKRFSHIFYRNVSLMTLGQVEQEDKYKKSNHSSKLALHRVIST